MTTMGPPPLPRRRSCNQYHGNNSIEDFSWQNNEPPIFLPPLHSAETPLLTPLDLLGPLESLRPGSPLAATQQNLSAMQNLISQRLLLAKEYGTSVVLEGALRKAQWERDRAKRMRHTQGTGSTKTPTNATKATRYVDWSPASAVAAVPPAHVLPSTTGTRPRSRTTIPVIESTSMAQSPSIETPDSYHSSSSPVDTIHAVSSMTQDQLPTVSSDEVTLTIQYHIPNPLTGISDPYHTIVSVPSFIRLAALKQRIWTAIQSGNMMACAAPRGFFCLNGWIESLVVHWDVDKQVHHHFPPTTELRDESLECMLVCLRDVRGFDWVEAGFEIP